MAFGAKKPVAGPGAARLQAVAGGGAVATASAGAATGGPAPVRRRAGGEIQPDLSRIRPRQIEESPEARKRRLAAKTVNFTATIIARLVIIAGAGFYMWTEYETTGAIHRGVAFGMLAMVGDLGRVVMKASEPGTK